MSINIDLLTKSGLAVEMLAKYFIEVNEQDRIKTVTELTKEINYSRGTVQNSIKVLVDSNAIELESRGHLGTFLTKKDTLKLLHFSGIKILLGVMPLPYSKRYEGLSSGILSTMESRLNIPANMAYMSGAQKRIEMVLNGRYDFAIVSKSAALEFSRSNENVEIVKDFGEESFIQKHVFMHLIKDFNGIKDGMKIGIDNSSIDNVKLTKKACSGKDVDFVNINYSQIVESLLSGTIDLAIWNGDELKHMDSRIKTSDLPDYDTDNTVAVIVIDRRRSEIKSILNQFLPNNSVTDVQNKILNDLMIPRY